MKDRLGGGGEHNRIEHSESGIVGWGARGNDRGVVERGDAERKESREGRVAGVIFYKEMRANRTKGGGGRHREQASKQTSERWYIRGFWCFILLINEVNWKEYISPQQL